MLLTWMGHAFSPLASSFVRRRPTGYGGPGTFPHYHGVVLPRRTGGHPWSVASPVSIHMQLHSYARTYTREKKTVYDVSSRESFEALPRWLEELENYVPPEVVKIVVGNKLDKVRAPPYAYAYPNPTYCADAHARAHTQEYSRQVPTEEGASFAQRTGCLFVEASAKTAVGVTEAFSDVVARIIDTPALWDEEQPKASSSSKARAARSRAAESMPGNIDLSQAHDEEVEDGGGCAC